MDQQFQKEKTKPNNINFNNYSFFYQQPNHKMGKSAKTIERELKQVIPKISDEQRLHLAQHLLKQLEKKGVEARSLQQRLSLSTIDPQNMNSEEISRMASYTYQYYPETFQRIFTQPNLVQFLTHPVLSAIVGIMAARWLNQ